MGLYRLLFVSKQSTKMKDEEIFSIFKKSKANNTHKKITGLLLYVEGAFMEVLEGEEQEIKNLYRFIASDKRHTLPKIILQGPIDERYFKGWSLGYPINTINDHEELKMINEDDKFDLFAEIQKKPDLVCEFLKYFYNTGDLDFTKFWSNGGHVKLNQKLINPNKIF